MGMLKGNTVKVISIDIETFEEVEYAAVGLLMNIDNVETKMIQKFDNVNDVKNFRIGDYIYIK